MPYPVAVPARDPASAAASRLPQWLLIVLTIAGLLWWQAGHCTDDTTQSVASVTAFAAAVHSHAWEAGPSTTPRSALEGEPEGHGSAAVGEHCQVVIKTTTGCATATVVLAEGLRTYRAAIPPLRPPATGLVGAGVTLVALGISRT